MILKDSEEVVIIGTSGLSGVKKKFYCTTLFRGSFTMERESGERFKVEIPAFTLESKLDDVTETIFA